MPTFVSQSIIGILLTGYIGTNWQIHATETSNINQSGAIRVFVCDAKRSISSMYLHKDHCLVTFCQIEIYILSDEMTNW